jgi:CubicO group peptidase (beta-lactamase class C family)
MKIPIALIAASVLLARDTGFSPERLQRITQHIEGEVSAKQFAGVNAAIMHNGRIVYSRSFGYRDLEGKKPMQEGTIFRIASMTKPITTVAAMILYEDGKFLLDDPVSKYIPGFANVTVLAKENGDQSQTVPLERPVTIRHLLTHTSGLINTDAYTKNKIFDHGKPLSAMASVIGTVPLAHQPGAAWRYGQSIDVLGYLVEVWSGETLDVFMSHHIFEPLAMRDTGFYVPKEKLDRVSKVYVLSDKGVVEPSSNQGEPGKRPVFLAGAGGLYSTQADYFRFAQMLLDNGTLDGHRILSRMTVDYMMHNQVPLDVIPPEGPNGRKGYGFGFGGAVLMDSSKAETLSVDGEYNWGGANGTYFWIDRENRLIGVWLVQRPPFTQPPSKHFKVLTYHAME